MKKPLKPRTLGWTALVVAWVFCSTNPAGAQVVSPSPLPLATRSQLAADPAGWTDLIPEADLQGWKRVAYPGKPLKDANPWSVDPKTGLLVCDGAGAVEMFLCEREFGDGIFHVEWRFKPVQGKSGAYNSGVFARNSADGRLWHQAQVGAPENVGYLFGTTLKEGKIVPFRVDTTEPSRGKPPGEWNTYEITGKGPEISLWINGATTAKWDHCEAPRGLVGLEAEGWTIEFRNVKFKATAQDQP